jgi:hypothetical protein
MPLKQTALALQPVPQAPQLARSVRVFTSQPSLAMALQLAKPALHAPRPQVPSVQVAAALRAVHARPQAPQCEGLVRVLVSQPSAAMALQLPKPVMQVIPQAPAAQDAVAFIPAGQALPQRPQFMALVATLVSQPSAPIMLQSARPEPAVHA